MSHKWHIGGSESIYDEQKMDGVPRIIKTSSEIEMNNLHQNNPKHTIKHVFTALIQQKIRNRNSKLDFLSRILKMEAENDSSSDTESTHFQDIDTKECISVHFCRTFIKWGASCRWSFRPNSARGSMETATMRSRNFLVQFS